MKLAITSLCGTIAISLGLLLVLGAFIIAALPDAAYGFVAAVLDLQFGDISGVATWAARLSALVIWVVGAGIAVGAFVWLCGAVRNR